MSSLWVKLESICLDSGKYDTTKLVFKSWQNKSINDIKYVIQDTLSVPVCDQKLFYRGNALSDDTLSLSCLYLRDGDSIKVEYSATADIDGMKPLIANLKEFSRQVIHRDPNLFEISRSTDFSGFPNYDLVVMSMENLAFEYFIPWKTAITVAQRHYFVQEGSFDDFMEVFKFSMLRYRLVDSDDGKSDISDLEIQVEYYNNEQMVLQMHCLSLLWNFSETSETRQIVLQHGGLQLVCDALLLNPNDCDENNDTFWAILSINETAVGSLVQYAEFQDTQQTLANNRAIVNKLMYMVECRLKRETSYYPLYSSQISANTLFCCACNIKSPVAFVDNGVHIKMIELTTKLLNQDHNMALRYYCCLFLARILVCPLVKLEPEVTEQIDGLLSSFMNEHSPKDVSSWEEKHNYVWVTLVPFVSVAFAGGVKCDAQETQNVKDETRYKYGRWPGTTETQKMGVFCIKHMLYLKENCQLLISQNLLPYLICLKWQLKGPLKTDLEEAMQKLPDGKCPPSLSVIARSQLAYVMGFEVALRM
ncbi:uncharacterized protein LOC116304079 [Actinia tenebrosa]|uniref:Uncharacterized protein LOC116304079 n=1 Tax=Actinia tenebrosa TaxID=6105 RepID=A0A6P8IRT4_ACTTE|nr:uncharacterized protein LOC116304079 [Actinia tenebrosa]